MFTPWGSSQTSDKIATGITFYSTASHGGIKLSEKRHQQVCELFPNFNTWAGGQWYEEDCDVTVVMLVFANEFDDATVWAAVRSAYLMRDRGNKQWIKVCEWLATSEAVSVIERRNKFENEHSGMWEQGSMSSGGQGWNISFTRIGDQSQKMVKFAGYPKQRLYSDKELSLLAVG